MNFMLEPSLLKNQHLLEPFLGSHKHQKTQKFTLVRES
jgi:hypothetical protein